MPQNNIKPDKAKKVSSWDAQPQQAGIMQERFLGCLLGGAVGDALGAPVEFMRRLEIHKHFGSDGITSYAPVHGGLGTITDDTQMTLFTAEGMIRGYVRFCFRGVSRAESSIFHAYLRWLITQKVPNVENYVRADGWLLQQQELHNNREPGRTCLFALIEACDRHHDYRLAENDSKGCGGVMRVAPVGLGASRLEWRPKMTFETGVGVAALTHGHPTGQLPAGVLAVLIHALAEGASLSEGLLVAKNILQTKPNHEETLSAINMAIKLANSSLEPHESIAKLGEGWIAEEALAISLYCALVTKDFERGVILAVNHDGDSDSTGAITGNILGALYGVNAIPQCWLEPLELRSVITELAEDLFAFTEWDIGIYSSDIELNEKIWNKYPEE